MCPLKKTKKSTNKKQALLYFLTNIISDIFKILLDHLTHNKLMEKISVSDENDGVRAKMLTWLLFHISEGEKGSGFYPGVDVINTDSVVTEH